MARRLDEALRPGGLFYTTDGTAVDAHGNVLEGAPARPDDTKPEDQPYARLAAASSIGTGAVGTSGAAMDFEAIGRGIAAGLQQAAGRTAANAEATDQANKAHEELRSGAESAKIDENRPAIVPTSATADVGIGLPATREAADAQRESTARATDASNAALARDAEARTLRSASVAGTPVRTTSTARSAASTGTASTGSTGGTSTPSGSSSGGPSSSSSNADGGGSGSTNDL